MFTKTRYSWLSIAIGASLGVQAQAQAQSLPEPMVQAARKAVATNPEVQARWHGFLAAGNERDVARGGYFPQIDLRASTGREDRKTPIIDYGSYSFNGVQLTLNQMLFDGLFTPSEVKRLGYAKLTRYYELAEASETAALEAMRAYADVVRYRELTEAAKQNYIEHKQTAGLVQERATAGVGRRVDVEQALGRLALAESNLLTELTNLHDVSARYLRIVGEKPPAVMPGLPDKFKVGTLPASAEALMREGLPNSPTLNAAFENVRAYKTAIETRKSAYMPRVDLRAYMNRDRNQSTFGVPGHTRVEGVELLLTYNLFRGGADVARERQAVDLHEQARDLKEKACRDVRQTLSIAYSDVNSLNEQLRYLDQHRLSTEKAHQAYRQQFELGQRTLLDMLDSQNEYFQANRAYINAHYNQIVAQARTLSGMGQLVSVLNVNRSDVPSLQDAGQDRSGMDPSELCPAEVIEPVKAEVVVPPKPLRSYVVLLPSPDGSVGRVVVQSSRGEQTLSKAQQGSPLDGTAAPFDVSQEQLQRDFGAAMGARPPLPEQFQLYFQRGSSDLTAASRPLLPQIIERARARPAPDMSVVGHTDTLGKAKANEVLGLRRAASVAKQIRALGLQEMVISVESNGESTPLVATPDETDEPRNRRVDITLR
jgi:outer membrane protein, adhesin transport system